MKPPKKLTAKHERILNRLIEEHHTMDAEFVVYEPGWNDRVIAVEARKLCEHPEVLTDNAVANHRRQAFGNFRRENHKNGESSRSRITQLQADLDALTARVTELEQKQPKLFSTPPEPRRINAGVSRP
jgi:hypothetical protein